MSLFNNAYVQGVNLRTMHLLPPLFEVGDLITYPGFPDEPYRVTLRWGNLYDIVDAHHVLINRVSLTGCKLVAS